MFDVGCGDGKVRRFPVSGTVQYKGQPVAGAEVVFVPEERQNGYRAHGKCDATGKFKLTTFTDDDGAVSGKYKVTVFAYRPHDPQRDAGLIAPRAGMPAVPERYFDAQTSELRAEIKDDAAAIDLQLVD